MKNPKFKQVKPNYKKGVLEIALLEGRKVKNYRLPFAVFRDKKIGSKNRFASIAIDRELGHQAVSFVLEDGSKGDFPAALFCTTAIQATIGRRSTNSRERSKISSTPTGYLCESLPTP